jgi:hypothetical protein
MKEGLALDGSVVMLNLYPCNIDIFFRLDYLSISRERGTDLRGMEEGLAQK